MRVTVGTITVASRLFIAVCTLAIVGIIVDGARDPALAMLCSGACTLVIGSSVFTQVAFVAFPKMRRGDITKAVICLAICLELLNYTMGAKIDALHLASIIVGANIVFFASFLERVRSASRSNPREQFSLAYKGDRRKLRRRTASDGQSSPLAAE